MKKIKFLRIATGLALAVLGFAVTGVVAGNLTETAQAEEQSNSGSTLVVSPMWQKIILTPGETWTGSIKVMNPNTSNQTLKYDVSVGSYSEKGSTEGKDDYGTVDVQTRTSYNQMMDWITIAQPSGELEPNESEEVQFSIDVPADAAGGGQYASLIVKNNSDKGQSGGDVMIQSDTQIASVIYAEVTGDTREEGEILDNSFPTFLFNNQLEAASMVENNGNVHGDVEYVLQVWPMGSDEEVCTNEEDPKINVVLPGTKMYHVQTCDLAPVGIYKAKQTVRFFGQVSEVEHILIVCPIWLILIIVIAIIVIIWLIVRAIRKRK